ncbi:hypothetical protein ACFL6I_09505 [candidate division KSB1 bacterium]
MNNEWREDLVYLLNYMLTQVEGGNISFLTPLCEGWYSLMCESGLKVDTSKPISEKKYIKQRSMSFDSTDKVTEIVSERDFKTNVPLVQILERDIIKIMEFDGISRKKEISEKYLVTTPPHEDILRLKEITGLRLSSYANKLERLKGIEQMDIIFTERIIDGYPDSKFEVHLSQDMDYNSLPEYRSNAHNWSRSNITTESLVEVIKKYQSHESVAVKINFEGHERLKKGVELYWIEQMNYWIAVESHEEVGNSSGNMEEYYSGPYKVEGCLAEKLLEAYNVKPESIEGMEVSKIPPSELKKFASR